MSGCCKFSSRVVAASIGLLGAVSAHAAPFPDVRLRLSPPSVSLWADPVTPFARYGLSTAQYLPSVERPFFNESERLEYEQQIEALEDISERIQVVIDSVGFLATDIIEQYSASPGSVSAKVAAIKTSIDQYRVQKGEYQSPSRMRADEASTGWVEEESTDDVYTPETVQQAVAAIVGLRDYIVVQETALSSFKGAIQALHRIDPANATTEVVEGAVNTLRESVGYWQMPAPNAPETPAADVTVPITLR
jgi:hypothetical protein